LHELPGIPILLGLSLITRMERLRLCLSIRTFPTLSTKMDRSDFFLPRA
jgi:hypothetical protein